jgi:orotate phosphoribosyltransferase
MVLVGNVLLDLMDEMGLTPDAVCGLTLGADPILGAVSYTSALRGRPIDHLIARKQPKQHGTRRWLEGWLEGVKDVVVIDDVWTTGGSTLKAVEAARESGLRVLATVALVDREEGARELLAEFSPRAAITKSELVRVHQGLGG